VFDGNTNQTQNQTQIKRKSKHNLNHTTTFQNFFNGFRFCSYSSSFTDMKPIFEALKANVTVTNFKILWADETFEYCDEKIMESGRVI